METTIAGSALAFIAFGANLLGTGALLMFNPRDRVLRWYALFSVFMLMWLALQGAMLSVGLTGRTAWWYGFSIYMMPIAFLTVTLVQTRGWTDLYAGAMMTAALLIVVFAIRSPFEWRYQMVWHAAGWGTGALLYMLRGRTGRDDGAGAGGGRRLLDFTLNLLVPVGVIGAILLRENFIVYALPAITIVTVFLLFVGIVYHRYYNIEIRAVRSGEIGVRAAEHERLALLGELSASIAHEVRNPLTGMRSLAQRLRDEPVDEEKRARYLGVILDEIGRLERIVSNLLDVARRPSVPSVIDDIDLESLFADLWLLVDSRARQAGVQLVARANALCAAAPREPLAQALLNLLLNAIAHAPPDTRVELVAERRAGRVALLVRDRGPGIPAADRERVFEPFHTGGGGTGLGLAVIRTLARDNSWVIEVDDAPGGGAELRLIVPEATA